MKNPVFAFAVLLLLAVPLQAANVDNLYQVELPVASQGQEDRNQAIETAFGIILVKATGDRSVASRKSLAPVLRQSARYVQQYRYRFAEHAALTEDGQQQRLINVLFDKMAVDRMLRQHGLPVWGSVRPQVLAWVGFENNRKRRLLIPDNEPELSRALEHAADFRGVPFLLPLMDLDDQSAVSSSDLWGEFEKPIREASFRYAADLILLVRVSHVASDLWRAKWSLLGNRQTRSWQNQHQELDALLDDGVQQMADLLAEQYAPAGGSDVAGINMQVSDVNNFDDLLRVQDFLQQQELVEDFQVRFVRSDSVVLALKLRGGTQAFEQSLALSNLLVPDEAAANASQAMPVVQVQPEPEPVVDTSTEPQTEGEQPTQVEQSIEAEQPIVKPPAVLDQVQLYYRLQ
ncbi:MAG: DUF2066 domain-containing protein [Chromatiales bacterium]|jgi:hypothetical protein